MKPTLFAVTTCLLALVSAWFPHAVLGAPSPDDKPQASQSSVAVINVAQIFKEHFRFKAMMAEMKAEVAQAEERVKAEQQEIKKMAEGLQELLAGTRDYLDLQQKINQRGQELKTQVQLQKAEFLQREANAYRVIYNEIVGEVAVYGKEHGLEVVLRTATPEGEPKTPQQVLQRINSQIVWFADARDITQAIVDRLNKKDGSPKPPTEKPAKDEPPAKEPDGEKGDGKKTSGS